MPLFYDVTYNEDGTIKCFEKMKRVPGLIEKQVVTDLSHTYYPEKPLVPFYQGYPGQSCPGNPTEDVSAGAGSPGGYGIPSQQGKEP